MTERQKAVFMWNRGGEEPDPMWGIRMMDDQGRVNTFVNVPLTGLTPLHPMGVVRFNTANKVYVERQGDGFLIHLPLEDEGGEVNEYVLEGNTMTEAGDETLATLRDIHEWLMEFNIKHWTGLSMCLN